MHKLLILLLQMMLTGILIPVGHLNAQSSRDSLPISSISLEECYQWARENYPLVAKLDLLEKSTQYSLSNAAKGNLPQLNINGQATYQSDVTQLPVEIPDLEIPTIDKDQYNAYVDIYQPLTGITQVKTQKDQIRLGGQIDKQEVEVDLYSLKERVNEMYFSLLLLEVNVEQLSLIKADLDSTLATLAAAVENGTATAMDQKLLEVEKISVDQQIGESLANKEAFQIMLSALTGKNITSSTIIRQPGTSLSGPSINRPELQLFRLQEQLLDVQKTQINKRMVPNIGLSFQGGYGRPALNFLSNEFATYYITGLKFSWNLSNLYTSRKEKLQLGLQQQMINSQKETFLLNNELTQSRQSTEISKYRDMIASDKEAVQLREEIKETAEVQLVNGLITTIDYIKILNDASRARQQLVLHTIMLLQAQYNLKTTTGN